MRFPSALAPAVLLTALALAGCGPSAVASGSASASARSQATARSSSASPLSRASSPAAAASRSASAAPAGSPPAGGPVPAGFAASSVTFVSASEAFVLGTAPCAHAPCTSVLRTLNRGATWRGLPAPVVPLGDVHEPSGSGVWGIRFASPSTGFVFGSSLWETTDGGERWARITGPGPHIESLEITHGQILAIAGGELVRRPVGGGAWARLGPASPGPIGTESGVAAVLDGTRVLTTANGGLSLDAHVTPCRNANTDAPAGVAVTGPDSLALLCAGGAAAGSVAKTVYVSPDLGATWTKAGTPPSGGDPAGIAGGSTGRLVVAAESGASWLYDSGDGGRTWGTAYRSGDGGAGFNDLGFTTVNDGVVVRAPAFSDNNAVGSPGQLLLTSDGGLTWHAVTW